MFHRWQLGHRQKGGSEAGETKQDKGANLMAVADHAGLPVAVSVGSAAPHKAKATLVETALEARFVEERPERLVGDKAYDSDPLDERPAVQGIQMMTPHRKNRQKSAAQDGHPLRRSKRRWKVERLFAWLQNVRRVTVRYERHVQNRLGFVQLGCIVILLRNHF
jgi:transposase